MSRMRKAPSGGLVFFHTPEELKKIRKKRQFEKDVDDIHELKLELEKELRSLKERK